MSVRPGDSQLPGGVPVPAIPPIPSGPPSLTVARPAVHPRPTPMGGKLLTPSYLVLLGIVALGLGLMGWRFASGLGATTGMSDGYPFGLWIAFDVVTGTAIACGGYAVALIAYVLNRGQYHPLVRPAILTSALGYSMAGFSIVIDVGRYWNIWKVPLFASQWNLNSALLEVALCIMAYVIVLWIEMANPILEKWNGARSRFLRWLATTFHPTLKRVLPLLIALALLLPTMHQSSLGTMLVTTTKLDPLWHTGLLPLLFLLSCVVMGFAGVVLESTLSSRAFKLRNEWDLLQGISRIAAWVVMVFIGIRLVDLIARNQLLRAFQFDFLSIMFLLETAMLLVPAALLMDERWRQNKGVLFGSALSLLLAGALYRFDVYLVGFNPGNGWSYFPTVSEILITVGVVAIELSLYVFLVRRFPILRGTPAASPEVRT